MKIKNRYLSILFILIFGFILRFININYGLPNPGYFYSDEIDMVSRTLKIASGDLKPTHFDKPTFYNMGIISFYSLYYIALKITGTPELNKFFEKTFITDPTVFYFLARLVSVLCGVITIFIVYLAASEIKDKKCGIIAALIICSCFTSAKMNHIVKEESLLSLLLSLIIFLTIKFLKTDKRINIFLAFFLCGLAVSTKYTGIIFIFIPLSVLLMKLSHKNIVKELFWKLAFTGFIIILGFGLGMPYFLLHPFNFISGLFQSQIFQQVKGDTIWLGGERHYGFIFIIKMIIEEVGYPLFILLIATFIYQIRVLIHHFKKINQILLYQYYTLLSLLLICVIGYFVFLFSGHLDYHYIMPFSVIFAIMISYMISEVFEKKTNSFLGLFILIILLHPLIKIFKFDMETCGKDTRISAAEWIEENISISESIIFDTEYFYQYHPPVKISGESIERLKEYAVNKGGSGRYFDLLNKYSDTKNAYNAFFMSMPTWADKINSESEYDINYIKNSGYSYIICSSYYYDRIKNDKNAIWDRQMEFYRNIDKKFENIKTIKPVSWKNRGPEIKIYKINK